MVDLIYKWVICMAAQALPPCLQYMYNSLIHFTRITICQFQFTRIIYGCYLVYENQLPPLGDGPVSANSNMHKSGLNIVFTFVTVNFINILQYSM
jgi:hypothetical protein